MKNSRIVSWLLLSVLAAGVGCGDDDKTSDRSLDSGTDPVVVDDTDASEADAAEQETDAAVEGTTDEADASIVDEADASVVDEADAETDDAATDDAATDDAATGDAATGDAATGDAAIEAPEIVGRWHATSPGYSGMDEFFADNLFGAPIIAVDNVANVFFTHVPDDAAYFAGKYGATVWTEKTQGVFYVCMIAFDANSLAEAQAAVPLANSATPEAAGSCGVSSWTKESPIIEIDGQWAEGGFGTARIDSVSWANTYGGAVYKDEVLEYDNAANVAYTTSAGTYNKLVWTEIAENSFHYCTVAFGLASLEAAKASTLVADSSAPDTAGCGTFPWSKLTRTPATPASN